MICYCDGIENGHEFVMTSNDNGVIRFECPICHRTITETIGEPQE